MNFFSKLKNTFSNKFRTVQKLIKTKLIGDSHINTKKVRHNINKLINFKLKTNLRLITNWKFCLF